jgi:uncharacterized protein (TIGR02001 family)
MKRALMLGAVALWAGHVHAEEPRAFVGATLTSNYLLDAQTQTQDGPAFQPYLEVEFPPGFYVGAWLSNVDFGDDTDTLETDLYLGFRGEAALFSYDVKSTATITTRRATAAARSRRASSSRSTGRSLALRPTTPT